MMLRSCLVLLVLLAALPVHAQPPSPELGQGVGPGAPPSIRSAIELEVTRMTAVDAAARAVQAPARKKNWFQRHPVATATIAGFLGGFGVGCATGEDGLFDDFTAEGNGILLGGIVAGSAATLVGVMRAVGP
jgi:hypothetical protein